MAMTAERKKTYVAVAAAVVVVALAAVYFAFDPSDSRWMPKCVIYHLTGFKCAGCGSQRAIHALLHGDVAEAWSQNALFVISLPFLLFLGWLEFRRKAHPHLYRRVHTPILILLIGAIIISWTLFRNI